MKPEDQKAFEQAFKEFLKNYRMGGNPLKDCAEGLFKAAIAHRDAQPALSHVNETPKNKHDSNDVLKRAPLVRLTDEDIKVLQAFHNFNVCTTSDKDLVTFAHAIQDAMQEKNK